MVIDCPDPHELVRLGTPAIGDATYERYDEHVEGCPACQAVLRRFVDEGLDSVTPSTSRTVPLDDLPHIPGFAIERELGRGAMGVVYLARQDDVGRQVALKLVPGGHAAGERERRRWLREAEAASRVRHPHVVTLYEFGEAAPWFYLALEFIPGGTVKGRLIGPLPPRQAARLVTIVARAVDQIHQDGCYHLDLKPSNILLEGDENTPWNEVIPKVSDFSVARLVGDSMASLSAGIPFGTPTYMAPEQSGSPNGQVGRASDVYALGAILYELLTGRPPIQRTSVVETLEAIRTQEPVWPRRLNPAISRDLETICLKCLRKEPVQRYTTAQALADDLQRYLERRPITARPVSPAVHVWRWCRRNTVVASLSAGLSLTAVCAVVVLLALLKEAHEGRRSAEKHRQIASDALTDALNLTDLMAPGVAKPDDDYHLKSLSSLRRRQQRLYQAGPGDRAAASQLVRVNVALVDQLMSRYSFVDAGSVLDECLAILADIRIADPADNEARFEEIRCHLYLSTICWRQKRFEDALFHGLLACQRLEAIKAENAPDRWLRIAASCHVKVAELLYFNLRRPNEAKRWVATHERWIAALTAREPNHPHALSCRARWLLASGDNQGALAFLRASVHSHPREVDIAKMLAEKLIDEADLLPSDQGRALLNEASSALTSVVELAELNAVNHPRDVDAAYTSGHLHQMLCHCLVQLGRRDEAIAVFRRLVSKQKSLHLIQVIDHGAAADYWHWRELTKTALMVRPFLGPDQNSDDFVSTTLKESGFQSQLDGELGYIVILAEGDLAVLMRRKGQQAEAIQQVDHMIKYASGLVARFPDDPLAHLALSEARIHVAKNAMRYENAKLETVLRHALDSAERALAISPGNGKAQAAVADCRRRLENVRAVQ